MIKSALRWLLVEEKTNNNDRPVTSETTARPPALPPVLPVVQVQPVQQPMPRLLQSGFCCVDTGVKKGKCFIDIWENDKKWSGYIQTRARNGNLVNHSLISYRWHD